MSGKVALQRARRLGPTHPDTLTSRMGLALAHASAGDVSSAHTHALHGVRYLPADADPSIRADRIVVPVGAGVRLRYVNCPFAPFLGSSEQNVCEGR